MGGVRPGGVRDDAQRLPVGRHAVRVAHRELRVVGEHGADADEHRVDLGAQPVDVAARGLAGDPAAGAVGGGAAAVESGGELPGHERPAAAHRDQPRLVDLRGLGPEDADLDVHARGPQPLEATGGGRPGVVDGDDHPTHPGLDQRHGAGAGAAGVVARLEGDDGRAALRAQAGGRERRDLGVRPARALVPALADDLAAGVHDHAAHDRVGQRGRAAARGELDRARHRDPFHLGRHPYPLRCPVWLELPRVPRAPPAAVASCSVARP